MLALPTVVLARCIKLKLASGPSNPRRHRDIAGALRLMKVHNLDKRIATKLHPLLSGDDPPHERKARRDVCWLLPIIRYNKCMGLTFVEITVSPLNDTNRTVSEQFLVDSGASHTVLPESIWKSLGLEAQDHVRIRLADGRIVSRPVGFAMIRFDGHATPSRVILGEADDSKLLGVVTLEEMGLSLDPLKRTLSAMELRM